MEKRYGIWLCETVKIGGEKGQKLLKAAGSFAGIYKMSPTDLLDNGITPKECAPFANKSLDRAERILAQCHDLGISVLAMGEPLYPQRLCDIENPPGILYYKGTWRDFDNDFAIAIVGQRKATAQGKMVAEEMGRLLAKEGFLVVSGLAAGIDGCAHRGAIKADGYTAGVLGTGVDVFYPTENSGLMRHMFQTGLVVSEYPPGTQGFPSNFPARNRIVSALSKAVVVVEAQLRSGSLITARLASEQGRDLFAVTGSDSSAAHQGCNQLVARGLAVPIRTALDLIAYYTGKQPQPPKIPTEQLDMAIYNEIKKGTGTADMMEALGISPAQMAARLVSMEIMGFIVKVGHGRYEIL